MRAAIPILSLLTLAAGVAMAKDAPTYRVAETIAVADGGWDYARVDPVLRRLYVARGASVTVVDLAHANAVREIGAIERGHAVVPIDGGRRLLVTSGNDATVRILDTADGREVGRVAVGKKPDAALYDERARRAYVMNAAEGSVSVVDPAAGRVVRTIAVKPALEYGALVGATLYVNDEDANEIEIVDLTAGKTTGTIALAGCEAPSGLGYDDRHGRLIAACANGKAAVVDARTRAVSLIEIGRGPDAVIVDPARRLAFIPCGRDGVLDILSLDAPGGVSRTGRVTTEVGARTGALDPATGAIYLPSARFAPPAQAGARPAAIPGSAHVLVVRPS